jgi:hypothetical protein
MRFLILGATFLSALTYGSNADASACSAAKQKYHAALDRHESKFAADVRRATGLYPKDVSGRNVEHCIKAVPVQQAAIPSIENLMQLEDAARRACPKMLSGYDPAKKKAEYNSAGQAAPDNAKQNTLNWISRCEEIIAKAKLGAPAQAASTQNLSGASAPPNAKPGTARHPWSGRKEDCNSAGNLERNTAAWYDMCVLTANAERRPDGYKPPISPPVLTQRASNQCGNVSGENRNQCVFDAKLKILLADDPNVRSECALKTDKAQIECVDAVFLYGPGASQGMLAEQQNLARRIAALPAYKIPFSEDSIVQAAPAARGDGRCPAGQGMKPTPGGFGGWSCQLLGLVWLAPNRPSVDADNAAGADTRNPANPMQVFERRVMEVAAAAVISAEKIDGRSLTAVERKACRLEAFSAVYSVMKGGSLQVSNTCSRMVDTARAELAYYAGTSIDTKATPGIDELLASFAMRGNPAAPPTETSTADCTQAETHWKSAEQIRSEAIYRDHLARFPSCHFATLAAARIEQFKKP